MTSKSIYKKSKASNLAFDLIARAFKNTDSLNRVVFFQHHLDDLGLFGRYDLTDKIRLDRQLPVLASAIDEDRKLHFLRTPEIHQLIECGPDRATGVEDVVDKYDDFTLDIVVKLGTVNDRVCTDCRKVIPIERDVDDSVLWPFAFDRLDPVDYPLRQRHAATPYPDYIKVLRSVVFFDDLRCEARQRSLHTGAVHDSGFFDQVNFVCHSSANRNKARAEVQRLKRLSFRYRTASFNIYDLAMAGFYERFIRPMMFGLDAETAHEIGLESLRVGLASEMAQRFAASRLLVEPFGELERFGLKFKNPIGIAAGFDKNGVVVNQLAALGFGFVEVGTVTFRPQKGNEKPRLFRLPLDRALINRLGFNNDGAEAVADRLRGLDRKCVVGVNIGKNKDVPNEEALENYLSTLDVVHEVADYIAVNVSSPNTPNLRELQTGEHLAELLDGLQKRNRELGMKPLFVKIAPDLAEPVVAEIVHACEQHNVAAIIATNTTIERSGLKTPHVERFGAGGLSGEPLRSISTRMISLTRFWSEHNKIPIIGVGGIFTAEDAFDKIKAGASLIQGYTGFVYRGPSYARDINLGLATLVKERGFSSLDEVAGLADDRT